MFISIYKSTEFESLYKMSRKLYPNYSDQELRRDLIRFTNTPNQQVFMAVVNQNYIGFIMVSIRSDYVEGASTSLTGYLEAIFVDEEFRGKGFSKQLMQKGETWLKENGCTEIGSDTWISHQSSIDFHLKIGFVEEDRLVHFIKKL